MASSTITASTSEQGVSQMEKEFFYKWTGSYVWSIIESTFEWKRAGDDKKVKKEFDKLVQGKETDVLQKYILIDDAPVCFRTIFGKDCWFKYIKPILKSLQKEKYRRFNDPIHGTIELHPLLCKIIDTPEFHRLNDIKQLGGVHYVYPNARHTRFEHSIGVCYLAGEFARMLQTKQPELKITDKDVLCVEIAGLIHDLGHGPFSHMFEYGVYVQLNLQYPKEFREVGLPEESEEESEEEAPPRKKQRRDLAPESLKWEWEHEKLSQKVFEDRICKSLQTELKKYGLEENIKFITKLIHYKTADVDESYKEKAFLFQIVANKYCGIDVDKWDYFARDGHFIGVAHDFDFRRLMSMSRVIWVDDEFGSGWRICFRIKERNNIYGMFRTRCSLFQRALHHKTKIAAELMLCRAIALAAKDITLTDKKCTILEAVIDAKKYITGSTSGPESGSLDGFLALTDGIINVIKIADPTISPEVKKAQDLLHRLSKREIFREIPLEGKDTNADYEIEDLQRAVKDKWQGLVFVQRVDYKYGSEKKPVRKEPKDKKDELDSKTTRRDPERKKSKNESDSKTQSKETQTDPLKDDPVRNVYFYDHKKTPDGPMKAECDDDPKFGLNMKVDTTELVRPERFSLSQIKVYKDSKFEEDSEFFDDLKALLKQYKKN